MILGLVQRWCQLSKFIRVIRYDLTKTQGEQSRMWGWNLWGVKRNGIHGPRKYTLDIMLGTRMIVIIFGRRY